MNARPYETVREHDPRPNRENRAKNATGADAAVGRDAPHPAGPCGGAIHPRADMESPPSNRMAAERGCPAQFGQPPGDEYVTSGEPCSLLGTPGNRLLSAAWPAIAFGRSLPSAACAPPGVPVLGRPLPPAANAPGGINPAPTNKFCVWGQTGTAAAFRAAVGRDALIPPDPAAVHPANSRDAAKRAANRFMQSPSVLIFPGAPPGPTVYGFIIWPGASNVRPAGAPSRLKYG